MVSALPTCFCPSISVYGTGFVKKRAKLKKEGIDIEDNAGRRYGPEDVKQAYFMGIDSVIFAIEKTIGMAPTEQQYLIDHIKDSEIGDVK